MPKVMKKLSAQEKLEQGYLGLKYTAGLNGGYIYEEKRNDLRFPQSIATYTYMSQHPIVAASNNLIDTLISKVKWKFSVPDEATGKMKEANRMLNYFMNNMDHSWKSFITEVLSYKIFGFYVAEKCWREVTPEESRKWAGKLGWKKLATRSQSTISKWDFDQNVREFKGLYQSLSGLTNIYSIKSDGDDIYIPKDKLLLFSYRKTRGNPEGHSLLKDCYQSWAYIKTLESFESVQYAKNIGGVLEIGIDAAFLAKAQEDSSSTEASVLQTIQENAENLNAGESTYLLKPISYTDTGKELFTFRRLGLDGTFGDLKIREVINGKQLEIMMIFLTDILRVGNENTGSFSLAESKQNLTSFGIESQLQFIVDVIQEQLVPQTLQINGFDLPKEQYPVLTYSGLDNESIDEIGKFLQRGGSVNFLPRTLEFVNEILERSGFKYKLSQGDIEKDTTFTANTIDPKIFSDNESGASEGMESGMPSGTGNSTGNNSAVNSDNKA